MNTNTMNGISLITAERLDQTAKHGYTLEFDLQHSPNRGDENLFEAALHCLVPDCPWPWPDTEGPVQKGYCRIHQLKVAAALIASEIDRLIALGDTDFDGPAVVGGAK